ncbi:MAG TPA: dihydrolipoamide acetyltransferase family protein, partial [Anaerolineaceae bacterium]|nr:dihydrolipoamide acetyltransferase family protein [Anaerolineaceae bacterium]
EIEGDKAVSEVNSPVSGLLLKIITKIGDEVPSQSIIALIGEANDDIDEYLKTQTQSNPESGVSQPSAQPLISLITQETIPETSKVKASPLARRLAQELGVDLSKVIPSAKDGLINRDDILRAKESLTASTLIREYPEFSENEDLSVESEIKVTGFKKIVGERMKQSYLDAPHFALTVTVSMEAARKLHQEKSTIFHFTYTDILIWAVAKTISKHKLINTSFRGEKIVIFKNINIGIAVATEKGLIVPVIKNADRLSLEEISQKRDELTQRVKDGKTAPNDIVNGTFTISNLGMFGIDSFSPIISPGQAAILGVGEIKRIPIIDENDEVHSTFMMNLTLVSDHRVVDGVDGSKFLGDLKKMIEDFSEINSL